MLRNATQASEFRIQKHPQQTRAIFGEEHESRNSEGLLACLIFLCL